MSEAEQDAARTILVSNICGLQEIAAKYSVSSQTCWNWTKRYDFPEPIAVVSGRPVWDRADVDVWYLRARSTTSGNNWRIGERSTRRGKDSGTKRSG